MPTGGSGNSAGQAWPQVNAEIAPFVRLLRLAPTVRAFLQVAGDPIDNQSGKPTALLKRVAACPSFPAAMTISMSRCSATNSSTSSELSVYADCVAEPQLLLWILAPAWYAPSKRSPRLTGSPPSPPCESRSDWKNSFAFGATPR